MTDLQRIRKETKMSFADIVKHYAGMKMSRTATAEEIGMPLSTFKRYLVRFNLNDVFVPRGQMCADCRGHWPKGRKRR